ncbi:MAG: tripartite tricarboxylate transporter substrate binding protein [Betaproteobacteria bacterium]|nr:tripartite tricarboxylate transporter substrate binding protein [Betaproteobacteria bacterium]
MTLSVLRALVLGLASIASLPLLAQDAYPSKTIRVVVPFPPAGGADIVARDLAAQLSRSLSVQVVVENRPGAGAQIGTEFVGKAAADGYTVLFGTTHHAINPSLRKNMPYDSRKDFTPIALIGSVYSAIIVRPDHQATTLAQLVSMAKQQPGRISFGSTGIGGSTHLSGELLNSMAGIQMTHVPYKGGQQALADLLGGQIPVHIDTVNGVQSVHQAGRVRILAVTSPRRLSSLPGIPTVDEAASLSGYQSAGWYMVFGPAGLPAPVVAKLSAAILEELARDGLKQRLAAQGVEPGTLDASQTASFLFQEMDKWSKVIERANIRVD